jgi:hypothetical protein
MMTLFQQYAAVAQSHCEPLITGHCALPFPSNFYRHASECDAEHRCTYWDNQPICMGTAIPCGTSSAVNLTQTLPLDAFGKGIDAEEGGWNDLDGFSALSPIVMWFGDGSNPVHTAIPVVDSAASLNFNAPRFWSMNRSIDLRPGEALESATVLIDADAVPPQIVAHWVELDHSFENNDTDRSALLMWPAQKLRNGRRYIVAVRDLRDATGAAVRPPSDEFIALRDGTSADAWRQAQMNDIIDHIVAAARWEPKALQLAFDFTTISREQVTSPLLEARDDALQRVGAAGAPYEIISTTDNVSAHIARKVQGALRVPLYLNQANPGLKARLHRDSSTGRVAANGDVLMSFEILIPRSLVGLSSAAASSGRIVQYGHGLFGDKSEVEVGYLAEDADRYGYVLAACDWWGLDAVDELFVATMLATDITNFAMVPDRSVQGVVNALMLMRALSGAGGLFNDKALTEYDGLPTRRGDGTIKTRSYFGNSQGGILGSVYMAVSTDVERGLIGVGGGPYTLLLPRSKDFDSLGTVLKARYSDPLDVQVILSAMQQLWDRADPLGFADAIASEPLPGTPAHQVVMHYGVGDAQVTWLGAQTLARSIGGVARNGSDGGGGGRICTFTSNVLVGNVTAAGNGGSPIFGVVPLADDASGALTDSFIVGFDFGPPEPAVPFVNRPAPAATDAHEKPRRDRRAQDMMDAFFASGVVTNTCKGACSGVPGWESDGSRDNE